MTVALVDYEVIRKRHEDDLKLQRPLDRAITAFNLSQTGIEFQRKDVMARFGPPEWPRKDEYRQFLKDIEASKERLQAIKSDSWKLP